MKILLIDDEPDICEVITISFNLRWPDGVVLSATQERGALSLPGRSPRMSSSWTLGFPTWMASRSANSFVT